MRKAEELSGEQMDALRSELDPGAGRGELFAELAGALEKGVSRVRAFDTSQLEGSRAVGKSRLPTTVGGLLVHIAEHTQRHVGQAITTAKIVAAARK